LQFSAWFFVPLYIPIIQKNVPLFYLNQPAVSFYVDYKMIAEYTLEYTSKASIKLNCKKYMGLKL